MPSCWTPQSEAMSAKGQDMRNRHKTIESLRRLAERPGTPEEGKTARRLLEKMVGTLPGNRPFNADEFPLLAEVWYAYWCYRNEHGYIAAKQPKIAQGQTWMRIKFDHLKQPRWVPITSTGCGCHLSRTPFSEQNAEWLYHMGGPQEPDWDALLRDASRRHAGATSCSK